MKFETISIDFLTPDLFKPVVKVKARRHINCYIFLGNYRKPRTSTESVLGLKAKVSVEAVIQPLTSKMIL